MTDDTFTNQDKDLTVHPMPKLEDLPTEERSATEAEVIEMEEAYQTDLCDKCGRHHHPIQPDPCPTRQTLLRPHLLRCLARMQRLITINAPGLIIGAEAFNIFATTLACYGETAGMSLLSHIAEQNLHGRGICSHEECVGAVERPGTGWCEKCEREEGVDMETVTRQIAEEELADKR